VSVTRIALPGRLRCLCALARVVLMLVCGAAHAQSCYVSGAFTLKFGTVTSHGGTSTSTVDIVCAPDYSGGRTYYYQVCLYMGPGSESAGQPTRRMTNYNGWYLDYDLYSDPGHSQLIGAVGSSPVYRIGAVVPPGDASVTTRADVYGMVYPNQTVAAGNYQEHNIPGTMRYRFSTVSGGISPDCSSGGIGGGSVGFSSSGVLATFENTCQVTATDLDFGRTIPPTQAVDRVSTIHVQCPANTPWQVGLGNGLNYNAGTRRMAGQRGFVGYQLYRDASRTREWGNTEDTMVAGSTGASGNVVDLQLYGRVPMQPDVAVGEYGDTVVVTLYY
jgi:spore coat protein U-like protein